MANPQSGTTSPVDATAPVVILGCHRSGTSAVAGLLVEAAGLRIGSPLPPTAANPKGYFESAVVVKAHNDALARLDRDWTCPPTRMPPDHLATELIRGEVDDLMAGNQPWGVKDPRLLFTLGLWCDIVPRMRFLGVVRDHEEVVRSLQARDGMRAAHADDITAAHIRRLRLLRDHMDFPIVTFSDDDFLESVQHAASALDLTWDQVMAEDFYDQSLAHDRGDGLVENPDVTLLSGLAPVDQAPAVDSRHVREVLDEVAKTEEQANGVVTRLSLHAGVRAAWRRRQLWDKVPEVLRPGALELTWDNRLATTTQAAPEQAKVHEVRNLDEVVAAVAPTGHEVLAIVAGDFGAWLAPDQLEAFIGVLAEHLGLGTTVVLGMSEADRVTAARLDREPMVFSDVLKCLDGDFRVVDQGRHPGQEWVRATVRTSPGKQGQALARQRLESSRAQQLAEAATEQARVTDQRAKQAEQAADQARTHADRLQHELTVARDRAAKAEAALAVTQRRADEARAEITRISADATDWRDKYTQMRASRVVSTSLVVARAAAPVVRVQRKVRGALGRLLSR